MATQPAHYHLLRLYVENGNIVCRYYQAPGAANAILWLGGSSGGFDSPAHGIYDKIAVEFQRARSSSLWVRYRVPNDLETSVEDALVGLEFLRQQGIARVALVGYAFGGAVAIQAGAMAPEVAGVAALACQSFGTSVANRLSPRPLLLVAGSNDTTLPPSCSEYVYENALEPKQLVVVPADHSFSDAAPRLKSLLVEWIDEVMSEPHERGSRVQFPGPSPLAHSENDVRGRGRAT